MCIYDDENSVLRKKTSICNAKFGDLGDNGDRGSKDVVESAIMESLTLICLFTMQHL